jgi:hypothetical protein
MRESSVLSMKIKIHSAKLQGSLCHHGVLIDV